MGTVSCFLLLSAGIIKDSRNRTDCRQSPQNIVDKNNISLSLTFITQDLSYPSPRRHYNGWAQLCERADWAVTQRNRSRAVQHFLKTHFYTNNE